MASIWDAISDFLSKEAGQRRTQALNEGLAYYVPPELRQKLGLLAEMTPTATAQRAGQAGERMLAPDRTVGQRVGDLGAMLSETAGVVAPAVVAGRAAMPVAQAVQEGLLGFSMGADDMGRRFVERMNQPGPVPTMYSNPLVRAADEPSGIRAYHGSPHDFGRFDFSKMGAGEGAQAYGRGGYFASEADVARGFRKGEADLMIGNKPVSKLYDEISSRADRLSPKVAEAEYNKMAVLEDLMNDGDVLGVRERAAGGAYDPAAMDWFEKEVAPKFKGSGSLYEVNIKTDPAEFLDWEKPLSEQPKKVLDALDPFIQERLDMLEAAGQRGREIALEKGLPDYTPKTREELFARLRGGDIAASGRMGQSSFSEEALQQAGVPGIKYLDPSARSTNYVVFDENLIEIVKKYGIAGAAALLGVSALDVEQAMAQGSQPQPQGLLSGVQ